MFEIAEKCRLSLSTVCACIATYHYNTIFVTIAPYFVLFIGKLCILQIEQIHVYALHAYKRVRFHPSKK